MTSTARFSRFHIKHGMPHTVGTGDKYFIMTFRTGIRHLKMGAMTEHRAANHWNIANLVTFYTITLNGKCTLAVMTAATGFTLLHLEHGDMLIGFIGFKQGIMTICTGIHFKMLTVFESKNTKIGNSNFYRINYVARDTFIKLRCFGIFLVMASSAGFSFLHFRHSHGRVF